MKYQLILFFLQSIVWQKAWAADQVTVLKRDGAFFYWSYHEADWVPIEPGASLAYGVLVQAFSSGSLRLSLKTHDGQSKQVNLVAESPSLWRLTENIGRNLTIMSMYQKELAKDLLNQDRDKLNFNSAWQRKQLLYSSLQHDPSAKAEVSQTENKLDDQTGASVRILHPSSGSILVTDRLPMLVPIVWANKHPSKIPIKFFLGPSEDDGRLPMISSTLDSPIIVPIEAEGSYSIAVSHGDGDKPKNMGSFFVFLTRPLASGLDKTTPKAKK